MDTSAPYTLVSIPASNYVMKARWGLKLAKIEFHEDMHAPLFHRFSTRPKGGKTVPLLYANDNSMVLVDSDAILTFCGKKLPTLYPDEHVKPKELEFDNDFGPHARRYAYGMAFAMGTAAKHLLCDALQGKTEYYFASCMFPVIKTLITKAFNVSEAGIERSWTKIEQAFNQVDKILGDAPLGSKYLTGNTFTAADISFCSHAGLFLVPPENQFLAPYIKVDEMPPKFRERHQQLVNSKAGQFVLYCFKTHYPQL